MPFTALTDAEEIADAYTRLVAQLKGTGAQPFQRSVGWQGGGGDYTVYWHPALQLWGLHEALSDHYWFGFGTNDPGDLKTFGGISAQISFWCEGTKRTRAGVFCRDSHGEVFVAHSGGIGGGREGIGKEAFLDWYAARPNCNTYYVQWPRKVKAEYILLGALDDPQLLKSIAAFVRDVEVFKAQATAGSGSV